jgi:hypothetical protein
LELGLRFVLLWVHGWRWLGHVYGIVSLAANDTIQIRAIGTVSFYGSVSAGHSSLNIHLIG